MCIGGMDGGKRGSRRGNLGGSKVEGAESDGKCVQTWC